MIYALVILDKAGSPIYSWIYDQAPRESIRRLAPELISGFISAIVNFGSEILDAPRYIDMGFAGASIVNLKVKDASLLAFVLADSDDDASAINLFVEDFKREAEKLLSEIVSVSEEGFVVISEKTIKALNKVLERTIKRHTRWLASIRSDDRKAFLFSLAMSIPIMFIIGGISYEIFLRLMEGTTNGFFIAAFLVFWWIPVILAGILIGYIASRAAPGFFAGLLGYLIYWLLISLPNSMDLTAILGGAMYSIVSAIFAFVSGKHFDSVLLTRKA